MIKAKFKAPGDICGVRGELSTGLGEPICVMALPPIFKLWWKPLSYRHLSQSRPRWVRDQRDGTAIWLQEGATRTYASVSAKKCDENFTGDLLKLFCKL